MKRLSSKIKKQLKDAGVQALYLFGSRAQGLNTERSDYDFAIFLNDPIILKNSEGTLYDKLYVLLGSITKPETLEADVIDIVYLDSSHVSLELKSFIIRTGKLLLDGNPHARASKESDIMLKTADFAPLRKLMSNALMERPTV